MILLDSSAWIAHFRGSDVPATAEVRRLLREHAAEMAMCDPVAMELLAGASPGTLDRTDRLISGLPTLRIEPDLDFRTAADAYRAARRRGETVRSLVDCLIAAIAVRHGAQVVHRDRDFEVLASVTGLDQRRLD